MKEALTFDDVSLVPQFSFIESRRQVDLSTCLVGDLWLNAPIVSANMDTITEERMINTMSELGCSGVLHRFCSIEDQVRMMRGIRGKKIVSVGVKESDKDRARELVDNGADALVVDVAHGDSYLCESMVKYLVANFKVPVIAGNIATAEGARHLIDAGAKGLKVGIGPGGACTTRVVTGFGVPQLTALMDVSDFVRDYDATVSIIADGGIRKSGDIVKALAFADTVMLGSMLAGTTETPGKIFYEYSVQEFGRKEPYECKVEVLPEEVDLYKGHSLVKVFRGMASASAKKDKLAIDKEEVSEYTEEGIETKVAYRGSVVPIIRNLLGGIRSGLSYAGALNIQEFAYKAEFVKVSHNGFLEGTPHVRL